MWVSVNICDELEGFLQGVDLLLIMEQMDNPKTWNKRNNLFYIFNKVLKTCSQIDIRAGSWESSLLSLSSSFNSFLKHSSVFSQFSSIVLIIFSKSNFMSFIFVWNSNTFSSLKTPPPWQWDLSFSSDFKCPLIFCSFSVKSSLSSENICLDFCPALFSSSCSCCLFSSVVLCLLLSPKSTRQVECKVRLYNRKKHNELETSEEKKQFFKIFIVNVVFNVLLLWKQLTFLCCVQNLLDSFVFLSLRREHVEIQNNSNQNVNVNKWTWKLLMYINKMISKL